ncbi:VOC family protein [Devosia sp.]|uniref:VOC family protein n=1 Tax=Devosia sp. TaxID=1871048 RepID=UPI001B0FF020|nr:VOC family protein [Devosia sp.]MBO9588259.1 VOC family protein [Devosia sp.]
MILHVEIAATDLDRAMGFYREVFGVAFAAPIDLHESRMAYVEGPFEGASWALCQGEVYVPTQNGAILYFAVDDIDAVLSRAENLGSNVLFPKTTLADGSHVAEIGDSEGNRIAVQTRG